MIIVTERLLLRPVADEDLYDLHACCAEEDVGYFAGWPTHRSVEETREALAKWIAADNRLAVVYAENRKTIGYIGVYPDSDEGREDTRELGFALCREYRRRGLMREAVRALTAEVFAAGEVRFLWACCYDINEASRYLIENCGFSFIRMGAHFSPAHGCEIPSREYCLTNPNPPAAGPAPTDPPAAGPAPTGPPAADPAPTDPPAAGPTPTDPPATLHKEF